MAAVRDVPDGLASEFGAAAWGNPLDLFDFNFDPNVLQVALDQQKFEISELEPLSSFHGMSPKSEGTSTGLSFDSPLSLDSIDTILPGVVPMQVGEQSSSDDGSDGNDKSRRRAGRMDPETRRQSRVVREKKRQQNISNGYDEIKALVPGCSDYKISRATILQRCATYLVQVRKTLLRMQKDNEVLRLENAHLTGENAQLRALLDESTYGQGAAAVASRAMGAPPHAPAAAAAGRHKSRAINTQAEAIELGLPAGTRRPSSYADQQVLMLLCAFFLIFPTVGLFNPEEADRPSQHIPGPGRELHSLSALTDVAGGIFRSRVALHMLLCFRSLAVMVIARIFLLGMDPAISAGAEALERASKL
eukprot:Opistho-2@7662